MPIPALVKAYIARRLDRYLARHLDTSNILSNPYVSAKLAPLRTGANSTVIDRSDRKPGGDDLPVPPPEMWEGYGTTEEEYLACGREDVHSMLRIIEAGGGAPATFRRVLEFGCSAGRMLRFYPQRGGVPEVWGVDIKARHIAWCQQHLTPPFRFATTTTAPHLPFEDGTFDLVFCGSVFTHIGDLADAWFLELCRVIRRGGYAYITVHDKHSVELLLGKYRDRVDLRFLVDMLERLDAETGFRARDWTYLSVGTEPRTQVFHDVGDLARKWSGFATVVSVTPEAYGYQTAVLVRT